jgi:hypothetical protein
MSNDFVGACYAVYIDIDCLKIGLSYDAAIASLTTKLPAGIPGPCSGIIFSGGGVQGYWLLRVPFYCGGEVDKLHYFKMRLCGVIEAYQGSADNAVQAACQAMRLAWTWNLPDLNKQRLGRSKALASVIIWNPGRVYDLEEFPVKEDAARPLLGWQVKENERLAYAMVAEPVFIESLDQLRISDKCKRLIAQGNDDGEIHNQEEYSIIMHMLRVGVPPNVVLGVITDTRFLIGSYEATKKEDNARRQIVRALVRLTIERGIELDQLKNERFEDDDDSGE